MHVPLYVSPDSARQCLDSYILYVCSLGGSCSCDYSICEYWCFIVAVLHTVVM